MIQESLLPGTKALTAGTVEICKVRRKKLGDAFLIRYRHKDGITLQRVEKSTEEAHAYFWKCAEELRNC